MHITTENDFTGLAPMAPDAKFHTLRFGDGTKSRIPCGFFRDWQDNDLIDGHYGTFEIGRSSGFGVGSLVKYDSDRQSLRVGRFVAGGLRLRFLLNGQHEMGSISTYLFSVHGQGLKNPPMPQYGDTVLKNDIWIGDEALFLGGSCIENGCVIGARTVVPPNFQSEPYGVYVGSPARLVKFRFPEKVREALVELAWWDLPLEWLKENNALFMLKLSEMPESAALDVVQVLLASKQNYLARLAAQPA